MDDELFDALGDTERRRILLTLLNDRSRDGSMRAEFPRERERETIEKHHVHLPKLSDHGFIEWDEEAGTVTRGPRFDEVSPFLELWNEHRGGEVSD